jgi:hypothetical protein
MQTHAIFNLRVRGVTAKLDAKFARSIHHQASPRCLPKMAILSARCTIGFAQNIAVFGASQGPKLIELVIPDPGKSPVM